MKIGLMRSGVQVSLVPAVAKRAEELGFESFWTHDHLILPAVITEGYPHSPTGEPPFPTSTPWVDAAVVLASAAAVTQRILLGTSVYILPLRHPFVSARSFAALDLLSNGRLIFGVGSGWARGEFEAVGQEFSNRSRRGEEILQILKLLWTEETIEFHGEYYSFGPVKFEPKPVQKPYPPIHFGGTAPAALRRAVSLGDGWVGLPTPLEQTREIVQTLRRLRAESDQAGDAFEITVYSGLPSTAESMRRYEEMGVDRVGLLLRHEPDDGSKLEPMMQRLEQWANDILAKMD